MTDLLIHNVRAMRPGEGVVASAVLVKEGRIAALDPASVPPEVLRYDGAGQLLTPGLIDIHIHGVDRFLFESSPEGLSAGLACLARFGVTSVLPTFTRLTSQADLSKLTATAESLPEVDSVRVPGLHLEGPFLARPGAGIELMPGNVRWLDQLLEAAGGRVTAMSVSPDTENILPVIQRLVDANIKVLLTHTCANVEQTEAAIEAGASHATHFYDVFHLPGRSDAGVRPVGAVEAILADDRVSVDFIADGIHVHPTAIRAALKAKGPRNVLLITDANMGAGLPPGVYPTPWGFSLRIRQGDAPRIDAPGTARHGLLAGSALTMNVGVQNLLRWLDLPEHDVWAMATRNVADRMGLAHLGDLRVGAAADLVLWDQTVDGQLQAVRTWTGGRTVFAVGHPA